MLIDCSYFTKGPRHILNASMGTIPNPNAVEVNAAIESYIEEYQERYLTQMLGSRLGNRVNAYLICQDEDFAPQRNSKIDAVCDQLCDSFADYIFFHILRDNNTQSTITGLVRLKSANDYVAPLRRQVSVWNSMVDKNRLFTNWCSSPDNTLTGITTDRGMLTYINCLNL